MRKIIAAMLCLVFLLPCGCAAGEPDVSVLFKCRGNLTVDEAVFEVDVDFTDTPQTLIIKSRENAFDTVYTFQGDVVELQYDDIVTQLDFNHLPDTNLAVLFKQAADTLANTKPKWQKTGEKYAFSASFHATQFHGECRKDGKLLSLEIPQYGFYFKASE